MTRLFGVRVAVVGSALVVALACTGPAMHEIGDAMIDAGRALTDADDAMTSDATASDATMSNDAASDVPDAQDPAIDASTPPAAISAACDHIYTRVDTYASYTMTWTIYRAEVAAPGLAASDSSPIPHVWTRTCERDLVRFGTAAPSAWSPVGACPASASCTGTPPVSPACSSSAGGYYDDGHFYVDCGFRAQTHYTGTSPPPDSDTGQHYTQVTVELP